MNFLKANFDKLLLSVLLVFFVAAAIHYSTAAKDLQADANLVLGALLGLITGARLTQRSGDQNGNGNGNGNGTKATNGSGSPTGNGSTSAH